MEPLHRITSPLVFYKTVKKSSGNKLGERKKEIRRAVKFFVLSHSQKRFLCVYSTLLIRVAHRAKPKQMAKTFTLGPNCVKKKRESIWRLRVNLISGFSAIFLKLYRLFEEQKSRDNRPPLRCGAFWVACPGQRWYKYLSRKFCRKRKSRTRHGLTADWKPTNLTLVYILLSSLPYVEAAVSNSIMPIWV